MDAISNMLTSLLNGMKAKKDKIAIPFSNLKYEIARVFKEKGIIRDMSKKDGNLIIKLKYNDDNSAKISIIKRISSPGKRIYISSTRIPKIRGGLGFLVISTSRGVMDGARARKENVGGELICKVW